eukprot:tig00000402_g229.t1
MVNRSALPAVLRRLQLQTTVTALQQHKYPRRGLTPHEVVGISHFGKQTHSAPAPVASHCMIGKRSVFSSAARGQMLREGVDYIRSMKEALACTDPEERATRLALVVSDASKFAIGDVMKAIDVLDKRVDGLKEYMKTNSEALDKRVDGLKEDMKKNSEGLDKRVDGLKEDMKKNSEGLDKRVDGLKEDISGAMKTNSEALDKRMGSIEWLIQILVASVSVAIAIWALRGTTAPTSTSAPTSSPAPTPPTMLVPNLGARVGTSDASAFASPKSPPPPPELAVAGTTPAMQRAAPPRT